MVVGNKDTLAIETQITEVFENPGSLALGYFVLWVRGIRYGVAKPDATLLANSFDTVVRRIADRGRHVTGFCDEKPNLIAASTVAALYEDIPESDVLMGYSVRQLQEVIYGNELLWAPDGDEAFDDSSFVLQFDCKDQVRIVAFRRDENDEIIDLKDVWMTDSLYYQILAEWVQRFETERASLLKSKSGS